MKLGDLIAVKGDPLTNITIPRQLNFVMNGGFVVLDSFQTPAN
jgi:hypothetical protein